MIININHKQSMLGIMNQDLLIQHPTMIPMMIRMMFTYKTHSSQDTSMLRMMVGEALLTDIIINQI